jgi:hypothetical protein
MRCNRATELFIKSRYGPWYLGLRPLLEMRLVRIRTMASPPAV